MATFSKPQIVLVLASAVAASAALSAGEAHAQRANRSRPACGIKFLPLQEGNRWVYQPVESPLQAAERDKPGLVIRRERNTPRQAQRIEVEVLSIDTESGQTQIRLREKVDELELETTLQCTSDGLTVPPESLFYAGQPGGALLISLEDVEREGELQFPLRRGGVAPGEHTTSFKAKVARRASEGSGAQLGNGELEVQRKLGVGSREALATPSGTYRATRVQVELSGRARMEPNLDKPLEMPAGTMANLWFEDGLGLVQLYNSYGHMYQLVEHDLP